MTNRVIFGDFNGEYVLRVSRPGYNVAAALATKNLAFDSRWPDALTVHQTGSFSTDDTISVSFPSLGYVPVAFVMAWDRPRSRFSGFNDGEVYHTHNKIYVDQSQPHPVRVYYVIFKQKLCNVLG